MKVNKPKDDYSIQVIDRFLDLVMSLKIKYHEYRTLFENDSTYSLLIKTAGSFFKNINDLYVDSILLDIAKLTDPKANSKSENFSISNVIHSIEWSESGMKRLIELEKEIMSFREYIKKARDKILSHLDKKTVLNESILGEFPYEEGERFFTNLEEVFDICHYECKGYHTALSTVLDGDVLDLLSAVRKAEAYNRLFKNAVGDEKRRLFSILDKVRQEFS